MFVFATVEVLDALMNHLEETLEVVLSRGENLALDNRVSTFFCVTSRGPYVSFSSHMVLILYFVVLLSSRSCWRHCSWRSSGLDAPFVGGYMRSCCSVTAVWPDCCLESCCTRASALASSSSSPPTSAPLVSMPHSSTGKPAHSQVTLLCSL